MKKEGRTVFFSSHVLSEVERVCGRVGIIRAGELVNVEPTGKLVNRSFRHVVLSFSEKVAPEPFAKVPGVEKLRSAGNTITFTLHNGLDEIVKLVSKYRLVGLEYERPSLEEIFLTFYREEADENGGRGSGEGAR